MRKDIKKVVVERPRYRGGFEHILRTHKDLEDAPNKESMRLRYGERKEFNDFLAPIKGFLLKSCGRPWNDVYSEIRAHLNGNSTMQAHVLEHVHRYVEKNPVWDHGVPYDIYGREITSYKNYVRFYVDPKGFIRKGRQQVYPRYRSQSLPLVVFPDEPNTQYRMCDRGVGLRWYKLTLSPVKNNTEGQWDVFLKKTVALKDPSGIHSDAQGLEILYGNGNLYCSHLGACGTERIKKLNGIIRR